MVSDVDVNGCWFFCGNFVDLVVGDCGVDDALWAVVVEAGVVIECIDDDGPVDYIYYDVIVAAENILQGVRHSLV